MVQLHKAPAQDNRFLAVSHSRGVASGEERTILPGIGARNEKKEAGVGLSQTNRGAEKGRVPQVNESEWALTFF